MKNGIDVEFSEYEVGDNFLRFKICFIPPSDEAWFLDKASLKIENKELIQDAVSRDALTRRADGFECQHIMYYLSASNIPTGEAKLSIPQLVVAVDNENCENAQKNLDQEKTQIVIRCDPTINNGNFVISEKPKSMSDDEALLIVMHAFSYSRAIPVDWVFSFFIRKP
jgi:hypothetical protein